MHTRNQASLSIYALPRSHPLEMGTVNIAIFLEKKMEVHQVGYAPKTTQTGTGGPARRSLCPLPLPELQFFTTSRLDLLGWGHSALCCSLATSAMVEPALEETSSCMKHGNVSPLAFQRAQC